MKLEEREGEKEKRIEENRDGPHLDIVRREVGGKGSR